MPHSRVGLVLYNIGGILLLASDLSGSNPRPLPHSGILPFQLGEFQFEKSIGKKKYVVTYRIFEEGNLYFVEFNQEAKQIRRELKNHDDPINLSLDSLELILSELVVEKDRQLKFRFTVQTKERKKQIKLVDQTIEANYGLAIRSGNGRLLPGWCSQERIP